MKFTLRIICGFFAILVIAYCSPSISAQATPTEFTSGNDTGVRPFTAYSGSQENINLTNGNLDVTLPLVSLPGRDGHGFTLSIMYDSKNWVVHAFESGGAYYYSWQYETRFPDVGTFGWRFDIPCISGGNPIFGDSVNPSGYDDYILTLPGGGKTTIPARGTMADSDDGSMIHLSADSAPPYTSIIVLTMKDGTRIHFDSYQPNSLNCTNKIEDPDGNYISFQYNPTGTDPGYVQATDNVGRQITYDPQSSSVVYKDSNGVTQTITLNISSYTLFQSASGQYQTPQPPFSTPTQCPHCPPPRIVQQPPNYGYNLLSSVVLPTGKSYSFQYDGYGEITKISYPSGGYTAYDYTLFTHQDVYWIAPSTDGVRDYRQVTDKRVCTSYTGSCGSEDVTTYAPTVYQANNSSTIVTDPSGAYVQYQFSPSYVDTTAPYYMPREISRSLHAPGGALLRTVQTDYISQGSDVPNGDFLPSRVTTTLNDASGGNLVSKVEFSYDTYSAYVPQPPGIDPTYQTMQYVTRPIDNVTQEVDYDYGSGSAGAVRRQRRATYLHVNPINSVDYSSTSGVHILDRKTDDQILDGSGATKYAETQYEYDSFTEGLSASGAIQHTASYGTGYTTRGKVTAINRWKNTDNTWLTNRNQYDDAGNLLKNTDPRSYPTTYSYADQWRNTTCTPSSGNAAAYATTVTNALSQTTHAVYNSCSGTEYSTSDLNSQATLYSYDLLNRTTQTNRPDGGQTVVAYNEASYPLSITTTKKITSSANVTSAVIVDGVGRPSQTQLTSDPDGTTYGLTQYDSLGRQSVLYNPTRCSAITTNCGESTWGYTNYGYDSLSRVKTVTEQDGSVLRTYYGSDVPANGGTGSQLCSTTTYGLGYPTLALDEASKKRQSWMDALGRLIEVDEPDATNALTVGICYAYDPLDNLTGILQNGSHQRTFIYDSLSRLTSASNPEIAGSISYSYDANGNVLAKTAPAPNQTGTATVTTTYTYDALNRLTGKTYNDTGTAAPTPSPTYYYDQSSAWGPIANPIGRLTTMYTGSGPGPTATGAEYSYDPMGRIILDAQCDPAICGSGSYDAAYSYDLAGNLVSTTSGGGTPTIYFAYGAANRLTQVTSGYYDSQHPATLIYGITYSPSGTANHVALGNSTAEYRSYNNRLQTSEIKSLSGGYLHYDFTYGYNPGANNGDLASWSSTGGDFVFNRSYTYDALNRLATMTDSASAQPCKGLSWTYDAWGNRTDQSVTSGSCNTFHSLVGANNRLSSPYQYDSAGNMIYDGSHSYFYDAENRLIQVDGTLGYCLTHSGTAATACYMYDAQSTRIEKVAGGNTRDYVHDLSGNVTAEFAPGCLPYGCWSLGYVYANGSLLAEYQNGTTYFVQSDHLGSSRLLTAIDGSGLQAWDYLPFGELIEGGFSTSHLFTGKERDAESDLDNLGARYSSSALGRFASPDWSYSPEPVPYANLSDPQTLNLYAYVRNDPESFTDPNGHNWLGDFWHGLSDATWRPLITMAEHPIVTAIALKNVAFHPVATYHAVKGGVVTTTQRALAGNGDAIGTAIGTVGMSLVPGVGEAGDAAEAASDLARVGEAAETANSALSATKALKSGLQVQEIMSGSGEAIAGAGSGTTLRDAARLAATYGGDEGDWVKLTSSSASGSGGEGSFAELGYSGSPYEVHAYQNVKTGEIVELKTKFPEK